MARRFSRPALMSAAGISMVLLLHTQASAQDVDALQMQVEELTRQIQQLQQQQEELQEVLGTIQEDGLPGVVSSRGDDVRLELYGQVSRGGLFISDGENSQGFFVDNDNSSTRFGMEGTADISDEVGFDLTLGANIETEIESESTNDVFIGQEDTGSSSEVTFTERKLEVFAESDLLGNLYLGQGDTATQGIAEIDLSGTTVIQESDIDDFADEVSFVTGDGSPVAEIGNVYSNFDGLSRDDRVRYDTPSLAGFRLSTSAITAGPVDVALRYSGRFDDTGIDFFDGTRVQAGIGYFSDNRDDEDGVSGSASVLFANGLNFTAASGMVDPDEEGDDRDPFFVYGKAGYRFDPLPFGRTAFSIDYAYSEEVEEEGDEFQSVGLGLVQRIDSAGADLFLGYRFYTFDRDGVDDINNIHGVLGGARIRF